MPSFPLVALSCMTLGLACAADHAWLYGGGSGLTLELTRDDGSAATIQFDGADRETLEGLVHDGGRLDDESYARREVDDWAVRAESDATFDATWFGFPCGDITRVKVEVVQHQAELIVSGPGSSASWVVEGSGGSALSGAAEDAAFERPSASTDCDEGTIQLEAISVVWAFDEEVQVMVRDWDYDGPCVATCSIEVF